MYFNNVRLVGLKTIKLPIQGAHPSDRFQIKSIDGLGPPEADVSMVNGARTGPFYQGRRPQGRELVFHLALNPNYATGETVADLRNELYQLYSYEAGQVIESEKELDLMDVRFYDGDNQVLDVKGAVKRIEINPFSKDPEAQVVISCVDSYLFGRWYSWTPTRHPEHTNTEGGYVNAWIFKNNGTAQVGFEAEFTVTEASIGLLMSLTSLEKGSYFAIDSYEFAVGDIVKLNTNEGSRSVTVTRAGVETSLLGYVDPAANWIQLYPGDCVVWINYPMVEPGTMWVRPRHWGI